jgi:hypothetical protein
VAFNIAELPVIARALGVRQADLLPDLVERGAPAPDQRART